MSPRIAPDERKKRPVASWPMNIEAAMVATDGLIAATSLHAHAAAIVATSTGLRPMASESEPMIGEMTISMPAEMEPMLAKSAHADKL